jgi:hypothetical protein
MDMLVAGYEQHFSESVRYWRSRFIVIPRDGPPQAANVGPSSETLDEEEMQILGIQKLAEMFTKMRWNPAEDQSSSLTPIRLLHTTLPPAASVTDDSIIAQLDEIHAAGPLRKKISEREIGGMPLMNVAMAMREDDGVPIKLHVWHKTQYPDSFIGTDFVSWLIREFRDVSSRSQAIVIGAQLMKDGLFVHCRGTHGFLDG